MEQSPEVKPTGTEGRVPTAGPTGPALLQPLHRKRLVVAVVVVAAVAGYAWYMRSSLGTPVPATPKTNANATAASPTPVAAPTPAASPLAADERQTIGSVSILVSAGMLARENASLKQLFSTSGIDLVASLSIGNIVLEELTAKVRSQELTPQEAAKRYWRLDVMEVGNPVKLGLAAWVEKYLPLPDEGPGVKLAKGTQKIGGKTATMYTLTNVDLGLIQTIYFLQPKREGNVVILSSFEGAERSFQKPISGLLNSVQFN